jgi:hypothetical protein
MNILCIESFCPQKRITTLLIGSTLLKHGRHFDYWNEPLNMRMRVCYLDYHEAGLCCYLVLHIENLLRPLHLFYFNLWYIYRLLRILADGFPVFLIPPPQANAEMVPWLGHGGFLPNPFQFIIHLTSSHSTLYFLSSENAVTHSQTWRWVE